MVHLVVVEAFRSYKRGDRIEDPDVVAEILASEQQSHVVKVQAPAEQPTE